jgi:APA family basic amino acid/polyamine antiporter
VSTTAARPTETAAEPEPDHRLGLAATVALVVGGIVGTGIFTAPAAVATYGWLTVPAFLIVGLGSLAIALSFARLVRRTRRSGGPYVYADEAFGPFAGFLAAWTYWIQGWTGHATISVAGAGYLASLIGAGDGRGTTLTLAAVVLILPVLNNLVGTRSVGAAVVVTTVLKITALTVVAIVGLALFDAGNVGSVHAHGGDEAAALPAVCALLLFSFLGMEGAAVATNRVRDPRHNVPRAIVAGVAGVGILYLLATLAIQGTLPQDELAQSSAPFADAARELFGGDWAAKVIAAVAVLSALGSLNGWNMVNAEMAAGAARDGFFPPVFRRRTRGLPVLALLTNSALALALIVLNAAGDALSLFTTLALLSTFVYVFGYVLSVAAELLHALLEGGRRPPAGPVAVAAVALAFSIWMAGAAGPDAVRSGTVMVLLGIPAYVFTRWRWVQSGRRPPGAPRA